MENQEARVFLLRGSVKNERQRSQQYKVQQGVAIGKSNEETSVATRTRKCTEQVDTAESVLASAELLETIEVVPFHEDFMH